jgi:16S rRNA (guanine(527)-N(7))-methyltransferase RsmG
MQINSHGFKDYAVKTAQISLWDQFKSEYQLTDHQVEQFKQCQELLIAWNKKMNLTAITKPEDIIALHFQDSLELGKAIDMDLVASVADVGTGAGFPGIALKIKYPSIMLYLIEVNQKKITFLQELIKQLNLSDVEIYSDDWRTFLRHTSGDIDLFCARASLQPEELVRMFKPSCSYKNSKLVYWAAGDWKASAEVKKYITDEHAYSILEKKRKLVIMKNK